MKDRSEIDFLIQDGMEIRPIEVKTEVKTEENMNIITEFIFFREKIRSNNTTDYAATIPPTKDVSAVQQTVMSVLKSRGRE